ncbi:hypothetical protein ACQEVF_53375 [Nonomuraea polychroma]|uniref:hypothetical protein n=1 Tax=Nonomuraea polychroma TaxID=46176 RepID=UPI003D92B2BB
MAADERSGVPQPVCSPLTTAAVFLVLTIDDGGEPVVRELLGDEFPDGAVRGQLVRGRW